MVMIKDEDGDYVLKDPVILKQEVTGSTCEMDSEALALYYGEAHAKHKKKGTVRFVWWHSHANMNVFWSATDNKTIMSNKSDDFTVALVINVKGEWKLRVQFFEPAESEVDAELTIINGKQAKLPKAIMDEVKEKCEKPSYGVGTKVWSWKNGKKVEENGNQMSLISTNGGHQVQYRQFSNGYGYGYYNAYDDELVDLTDVQGRPVTYGQIVNYIDGLNGQYITTEITYGDWKKAVKGTNKQLAERKCGYRIAELKSDELDEVIYCIQPAQFVITESEHKTGVKLKV